MEGTPFGRYRLIELRGRGGMGEVWRAYDTRTDREVAIKVLPAHFAQDQKFEQRFRREAHMAARLRNPHVVPIHDYGEIDGRLYVDMRLIEGRDLQTVLTEGPIHPARAVRIIEQVAKALQAAHKVGLVHRDVKPSNVLLDEDDYAYLIDFGIARALDETRLTDTGKAIGTFQYMAPERMGHAAEDDARADIYSLACVLYECLTGRPPFAGATLAGLVAAHLNTPPPLPSSTHPGVPAKFDEVIATGMAKDPDQRYATTVELATAAQDAVTAPIRIADTAATLPGHPPPAPRQPPAPPQVVRPVPDPAGPGGPTPTPVADRDGAPPPSSLRWKMGTCAALLVLAAALGIVAIVLVLTYRHYWSSYSSPYTYEQRIAKYDVFLWSGAVLPDSRIREYIQTLFSLSWLATSISFLLMTRFAIDMRARSRRWLLGSALAAAAISVSHFARPSRSYLMHYAPGTYAEGISLKFTVVDGVYFACLLIMSIGLTVFAAALRKRIGGRFPVTLGIVAAAGIGLSCVYLHALIIADLSPLYADRFAGKAYIPFIALALWLVSLLMLGVAAARTARQRKAVDPASPA